MQKRGDRGEKDEAEHKQNAGEAGCLSHFVRRDHVEGLRADE
jgi:hypothetical protein